MIQILIVFLHHCFNVYPQVRSKLLEKKLGMERSEKIKNLRNQKKYGKKVCLKFFMTNFIIRLTEYVYLFDS